MAVMKPTRCDGDADGAQDRARDKGCVGAFLVSTYVALKRLSCNDKLAQSVTVTSHAVLHVMHADGQQFGTDIS